MFSNNNLYNTAIKFNISEINPENEVGDCLMFNKVIFPGEYECISRPQHTFYVLDINENTGVIKNCSESCDSCIINEENCINCTSGYYKNEDSNNKCLLESLIQPNYYKNESDNIYYKCYQNCYNCTNKYDEHSKNMNCISCINGYYFIYEEEEKNCYNTSLISEGYYLDINDVSSEPKFKKCFINCKTCNNSYSENGDMNCILCKDGFYKLNGTNNCYNNETNIENISWNIIDYSEIDESSYNSEDITLNVTETSFNKSNIITQKYETNDFILDSNFKEIQTLNKLDATTNIIKNSYYITNSTINLIKNFKTEGYTNSDIIYSSYENKVNFSDTEDNTFNYNVIIFAQSVKMVQYMIINQGM